MYLKSVANSEQYSWAFTFGLFYSRQTTNQTHTRTKSYITPFQMHHMVKVTRCYSLPPFCSLIFLCFQWPDKARSYQPTSKLTSEIALPITFLRHCVFWKTNCIFFYYYNALCATHLIWICQIEYGMWLSQRLF